METQKRKGEADSMAQKPMTKTELAALVERTGLSKGNALRMLEALAEIVTERVAAAARSPSRGSASSPVATDQSARCATRRPAQPMTKAADRTAKVVIAKPLKEAVNA